VGLGVYLAERVGFVPREPAPINGLGAIGNARTSQIHSNPEYEVQNRYSANWPARGHMTCLDEGSSAPHRDHDPPSASSPFDATEFGSGT
jgi:hypothetical protein